MTLLERKTAGNNSSNTRFEVVCNFSWKARKHLNSSRGPILATFTQKALRFALAVYEFRVT